MHGGSQIRHSESPRLNKKMIRASLATQVEVKIGLLRIFVLLPRHGVIYSLYYIPCILLRLTHDSMEKEKTPAKSSLVIEQGPGAGGGQSRHRPSRLGLVLALPGDELVICHPQFLG